MTADDMNEPRNIDEALRTLEDRELDELEAELRQVGARLGPRIRDVLIWWVLAINHEHGRRYRLVRQAEDAALYEGHRVEAAYDPYTELGPFLALCSCGQADDGSPKWFDLGSFRGLTQALGSCADHLEEQGLDRYRRPIVHGEGELTEAEIAEAWAAFVATDRLERAGL